MKTKRNWILLAVVVALLVAGCGSAPEGTTTIRNNADMFREGGTGTLTINNKANFDVIIFAGNISQNNVLGGIRAGRSRTFDISTLKLPARNGSFLVRAASFETYDSRNSRNLRITETEVLYTGLVVYDLNDPRDRTDLNIFSGINASQKEYIYVSNTSKYVLELRLTTPSGEKIATLAPLQENKKIFLTPLDDGMWYNFYATYVYINPQTNEITSFSARDRSERQRAIPEETGVNPMTFSGPGSSANIGYQVAFFRVDNQTMQSLNFNNGTDILADQRGQRLVRSGRLSTFELAALSGEAGQLYTNLNMELDNGTIQISRVSVKPGFVYDCIVTAEGYDVRETGVRSLLEDMQVSLFLDN